MQIGTTYSHRQVQHLNLDPEKSFEALLDFQFDIVRLACYWEEIETEKGTYDFSKIRALLDRCETNGQNVLVSVGMKAPRWPEYYFPKWLTEKTPEGAVTDVNSFLEAVITTLRSYNCILYWQVENEPLDPSGAEKLAIPPAILHKEVSLVRKKDSRPIVINLWGNELSKRKLLPIAVKNADIIGLDLYYKVPIIGRLYRGPIDPDKKLQSVITAYDKPFWITELQAEPWESNLLTPQSGTPSMNAQLLRNNYERVTKMHIQAILFWGFEYWLWKKEQGDLSLWNTAKEIVEENREQ